MSGPVEPEQSGQPRYRKVTITIEEDGEPTIMMTWHRASDVSVAISPVLAAEDIDPAGSRVPLQVASHYEAALSGTLHQVVGGVEFYRWVRDHPGPAG